MAKWHWLLVNIFILYLVLCGAAWEQTAPQEVQANGAGGLYNPKTVVTVAGTVVSMTPSPVKPGLPYLVYLTMQTGEGKINITPSLPAGAWRQWSTPTRNCFSDICPKSAAYSSL
jgi:hypothetical protein